MSGARGTFGSNIVPSETRATFVPNISRDDICSQRDDILQKSNDVPVSRLTKSITHKKASTICIYVESTCGRGMCNMWILQRNED